MIAHTEFVDRVDFLITHAEKIRIPESALIAMALWARQAPTGVFAWGDAAVLVTYPGGCEVASWKWDDPDEKLPVHIEPIPFNAIESMDLDADQHWAVEYGKKGDAAQVRQMPSSVVPVVFEWRLKREIQGLSVFRYPTANVEGKILYDIESLDELWNRREDWLRSLN